MNDATKKLLFDVIDSGEANADAPGEPTYVTNQTAYKMEWSENSIPNNIICRQLRCDPNDLKDGFITLREFRAVQSEGPGPQSATPEETCKFGREWRRKIAKKEAPALAA